MNITLETENNNKETPQKENFFKKYRYYILGAVLLLLGITAAVYILDPFKLRNDNENEFELNKVATVYINKGEVILERDGEKAVKEEDFDVGYGDKIKTSNDSMVDLEFDFGRVALDSNSELSLDSDGEIALLQGVGFVSTNISSETNVLINVMGSVVEVENGSGLITIFDTEESVSINKSLVGKAYAIQEAKSGFKVLSVSGKVIVSKDESEIELKNGEEVEGTYSVLGKAVESSKEDLKSEFYKEVSKKEESEGKDLGIGKDLNPPVITIVAPANKATVKTDKVTVKIKSNEDGWYWDGKSWKTIVRNNEHSFEVKLNEGENQIEVKIKDKYYNKTVENIEVTYTPEEESSSAPPAEFTITLSGKKVNDGVELSWNVSGGTISNGFKLVKSTSPNPVYPGNDNKYLTDNGLRSYTWKITDGKAYHFRICQYNGSGKCLKYSNDITVTAPKVEEDSPVKVVINLNAVGDGLSAALDWNVSADNPTADGFKILMSTSPNPVYPGAEYVYKNDNSLRSYTWDLEPGVYHFRVCQYVSGTGCISYSNDVEIEIVE